MGWKTVAPEKELFKKLANFSMKLDFSERQLRLIEYSKEQYCSIKVFFGRKNRQNRTIGIMLVKKQELKLLKQKKKSRKNIKHHKSATPPPNEFSRTLLVIEPCNLAHSGGSQNGQHTCQVSRSSNRSNLLHPSHVWYSRSWSRNLNVVNYPYDHFRI